MIHLSFAKYLQKVVLIIFSFLPSSLKIFLYRLAGAKIGNNVEIGLGTIIIPSDSDFKKIHIEDNVIINDCVYIFSKHLFLGRDAQIRPNTRIWGQSDFSMGKGAYIDMECHFDLRRDITLEKGVTIGGGSWFYTHMVFQSVLEGAPSKFGPITIQERSYLGANVFVLPDITVGHDAIIGARAVVTKNVSPDSIMVGNPAREIGKTSHRIKKLSLDDKIEILKDILYDFIHVYRERIIMVKEWDKNELILFVRGSGNVLSSQSRQLHKNTEENERT